MTNNHRLSIIAALAALSWTAACGGTADSPDEFFNQYEQTLCESLTACAEFPDVGSCRDSLFIDEGAGAPFAAAQAAGTVGYDSGAAGHCLDVAAAFSPCDLDFTGSFFRDLGEACDAVFVGKVAVGGECFYSEECVGDGFCEQPQCPDACCAGTCVAGDPPPPPAQVGQACLDFDECVTSAFCDIDQATNQGTCQPRIAVGQACQSFVSCVAGAYCNIDFTTGAGVCTTPASEGQGCNPDDIIPCDKSYLFCDANATCARVAGVGDPCDPAVENSCAEYAVCNNNTCQAVPGRGQTCDPNIGCLGDLDCVNNTCSAPELDAVCR